MKNILRFTLILFLVNFVAASILAGVYHVTRPKIEAREMLAREEALKEVMPESVGDQIEAVEDKEGVEYWNVFKGSSGRVTGHVFIVKQYGYSSEIEIMVGMKRDGTITGVRILNQNETPGLGAKIVEVVSDRTILKALKGMFSKDKAPEQKIPPYFTEQFKGVNVSEVELSKHGIEAITGATITSKAVVDAIKSGGQGLLNALP
ncbi:MAG: RnfABCDGE type electron transport complex subunit G [Candidatus Omnitrophica bacterium]|nr:RnfABCDGE type electron transport complex subunit G [Candidatus Omnitrophota bacterium]